MTYSCYWPVTIILMLPFTIIFITIPHHHHHHHHLSSSPVACQDVVFRAIAAGKHVVTANKALIAAFLPELMALLKANPTVSFNYEVSTI